MDGTGKWFDSRESALSYVNGESINGSRNIDIGCFQISFKWHGENFDSVSKMFDPEENAIYAARFLKKLYVERGNWSSAVGAYHSRTEKHAKRYMKIFDRIFRGVLSNGDDSASPYPKEGGRDMSGSEMVSITSHDINSYPFLKGGAKNHKFSSLVPIVGGHVKIIAFSARGERWAEE
nr:transglycosylase SLT domain-containing protein [Roseovarius sp. M141]